MEEQQEVSWVTLEDAQPLVDVEWQVVTFTPPPEQENLQYRKNLTDNSEADWLGLNTPAVSPLDQQGAATE